MPYDELLKQRRLNPYQAKPQEIARLLQVAARDLATAEKMLFDDLYLVLVNYYIGGLQVTKVDSVVKTREMPG